MASSHHAAGAASLVTLPECFSWEKTPSIKLATEMLESIGTRELPFLQDATSEQDAKLFHYLKQVLVEILASAISREPLLLEPQGHHEQHGALQDQHAGLVALLCHFFRKRAFEVARGEIKSIEAFLEFMGIESAGHLNLEQEHQKALVAADSVFRSSHMRDPLPLMMEIKGVFERLLRNLEACLRVSQASQEEKELRQAFSDFWPKTAVYLLSCRFSTAMHYRGLNQYITEVVLANSRRKARKLDLNSALAQLPRYPQDIVAALNYKLPAESKLHQTISFDLPPLVPMYTSTSHSLARVSLELTNRQRQIYRLV